jgi:hypothetical protein
MFERLRMLAVLPAIIGVMFAGGVKTAAAQPMLGSSRPGDTYVRDGTRHLAPRILGETYLLPLPNCPRTPAGHVRWDLCR